MWNEFFFENKKKAQIFLAGLIVGTEKWNALQVPMTTYFEEVLKQSLTLSFVTRKVT